MNSTKINTTYSKLVKEGETLIKQMDLAKAIYQELSERLHSETTDNINYSCIVTALFDVVNQNWGTTLYFTQRTNQIAHEWALELYWIILDSLNVSSKPLPRMKLAQIYNERTGSKNNIKNSANRFAEKKKLIDSEMTTEWVYGDLQNAKYKPYRKLFTSLEQNTLKENGVDELDYYFYVQRHLDSPFSSKNLSDGMIFTNFHQFVSDYISLQQKKPQQNFEAELSAFVFEKLYYGISYEKCMLSFFKYNLANDITSNMFITSNFFYDLFNTHYLSLTEHILQSYDKQLFLFWDNDIGETVRHNAYITFHLYNGYWLPLLFRILTYVLNDFYKSDTAMILKQLRNCVQNNLKYNGGSTYRNELLKTHAEIDNLKSKFSSNRQKENLLFPSSKNDRKEYLFSTTFFLRFFEHLPPSFIRPHTLQTNCSSDSEKNFCYLSPNNVIAWLENHYTIQKNNLIP